MNKVFGKKTDFAPVREDASRVIISYGYQEADEENATWIEIYLYKKQISQLTLQDVKAAITADINERTRERIISGMVWNGKPVWLSVENQLNFAAGQAPVTFKIGETEDGTPVYHTFETADELSGFWSECASYRQQCLDGGNAEKDSIDWGPYESLFPAEKS